MKIKVYLNKYIKIKKINKCLVKYWIKISIKISKEHGLNKS